MTPYARLIIVAQLFIVSATALAGDFPLRGPVQIESGLVQGAAAPDGAVVTFKGIPYAEPPVGNLRWREPRPAAKWEGVRKADEFRSSCIQPPSTLAPPYTAEFAATNAQSEDCLFLNIWTPARSPAEKLAVLFYIHGGSGTRGSGAIPVYNGEELARKGIIVVTVNFRLGIFSGMGHPQLTAESPHHTCGNYGMLDLIAALQWVRRNIAAFGGDPDKVTICGQSSGAVAMHYLTTSPLAKGLFRGAIGVSFPYDYLTRKDAIGNVWQKEQEGLKFAAAKKRTSIEELRNIPARDLIAPDPAVGAFTRSCLSGSPNIDGWSFILKYPQALDQGLESDVPTLTGFTADDFGPPAQHLHATRATFATLLPGQFGQKSREFDAIRKDFLAHCPMTTDQQAREMIKCVQLEYRMSDIFHWAKRRARTSRTPVYTYIFEQPIPWPQHPEFGAFHTSDIVYAFNNLNMLDRPWTDDDRQVAATVASYWANFVKTGNPNGPGLPDWPPFDANRPSTQSLGITPGPRTIARKERWDLYRQLLEN